MSIPRRSPPQRARRAEQAAILSRVLAALRAGTGPRLAAFDLDSTLFDNRPRQVAILHEFAQAHGDSRLSQITAYDVDGWDLRVALRHAGLARAEAESLHPALREFWRPRFFSSPYCLHDVEIPGAAAFVAQVRAAGAQVVYVTGRDESMRDGTIQSLAQCGFPTPGQGAPLLMKPNPGLNDDQWKLQAHAQLRGLGAVLAAFDNEPSHINGYARSFSGVEAVHLDTDHSGRPVEVLPSIPSVADFVG